MLFLFTMSGPTHQYFLHSIYKQNLWKKFSFGEGEILGEFPANNGPNFVWQIILRQDQTVAWCEQKYVPHREAYTLYGLE